MRARIIQRDKLLELVDELVENHEVIAPKDELSFGHVGSGDEVCLGDGKPVSSLKEFFFPRREVILEYRSAGGQVELTPTPPFAVSRVIIAARPCDIANLPILDKVFEWDDVDTSYVERRQNSTIISMACLQPSKGCFCVSVGGSPGGTEGSDVLLTLLGDVYHVEVLTQRGEDVIEEHAAFFQDSSEQLDRRKAEVVAECSQRIERQVDTEKLRGALGFDNPVWETIARQCVDCGACTFLCPTCHCFDIQDEGGPIEGCRVRLWDSCAFQDFTRMPVHQPRPAHYRRYRQRLMHKFKYYPENFGRVLCVGCGRCIESCPVGIDVTVELEKASE